MKAVEFTHLEPMPGPWFVSGLPRITIGETVVRYPISIVLGRRWKSRLRLREDLRDGYLDLGGEA